MLKYCLIFVLVTTLGHFSERTCYIKIQPSHSKTWVSHNSFSYLKSSQIRLQFPAYFKVIHTEENYKQWFSSGADLWTPWDLILIQSVKNCLLHEEILTWQSEEHRCNWINHGWVSVGSLSHFHHTVVTYIHKTAPAQHKSKHEQPITQRKEWGKGGEGHTLGHHSIYFGWQREKGFFFFCFLFFRPTLGHKKIWDRANDDSMERRGYKKDWMLARREKQSAVDL